MRLRFRRLVSLAGALLLVAGCFPSLEGLTGSAGDAGRDTGIGSELDATSDAGPNLPDASGHDADASHADAGIDPSVVFVPNGGFETQGTGCGPGWNGGNAALETSPNARTGSIACRVCRIGNPGLIQSAPMTIAAGPGNYRLTAWIRNSSTHLPSPSIVTSLMAMKGQAGLGGIPQAYTPKASYGNVVVEFTAPAMTDNLVVQLQNSAGADESCFVVDDISIERLP